MSANDAVDEVSTIGLDIAKSVFQIHGVNVDGTVMIRKQIGRAEVLDFFAALPLCLEASRRARARIIAAASSRRSVTR